MNFFFFLRKSTIGLTGALQIAFLDLVADVLRMPLPSRCALLPSSCPTSDFLKNSASPFAVLPRAGQKPCHPYMWHFPVRPAVSGQMQSRPVSITTSTQECTRRTKTSVSLSFKQRGCLFLLHKLLRSQTLSGLEITILKTSFQKSQSIAIYQIAPVSSLG